MWVHVSAKMLLSLAMQAGVPTEHATHRQVSHVTTERADTG